MCYISGVHEESYRVVVLWSVVRALFWSWYGVHTVGSCLMAKYWTNLIEKNMNWNKNVYFNAFVLPRKCAFAWKMLCFSQYFYQWMQVLGGIFSSKWKSFEIPFSLTFHFLKVSLFTKVISYFLSIKPHDLRFHFHKSVLKYYTSPLSYTSKTMCNCNCLKLQ